MTMKISIKNEDVTDATRELHIYDTYNKTEKILGPGEEFEDHIWEGKTLELTEINK